MPRRDFIFLGTHLGTYGEAAMESDFVFRYKDFEGRAGMPIPSGDLVLNLVESKVGIECPGEGGYVEFDLCARVLGLNRRG